ncbi:MAG: amidohydrolase family protein, partial [Lysobacter sp.]
MKRALGLCLLAVLVAPAWSAETLRYVALVDGGKQAGHQVVILGDDGVTRVDYLFKDNGRGPELKEEFTLGEDGTFLTYKVKGTTTFGAQVAESFSRRDGQAQWKSTSDEGKQAVAGTALYSPLAGTPAGLSVAFAAIAKRADGKLPMIPHGMLSMRKIGEAQITRGGSAGGDDKRTVQLVALTGQGLTPTFAWATTEASPRLFAFIYPGWLQLIEDGWQGNAAALEEQQKQAEGKVLVDMAKQLAHPLAGSTVIRNARVFDSENATLGPVSDVLIRDGRIESIRDRGWATSD